MSRLRSPIRAAAGLATVTVLSLTASGCVTVHGELAVLPAADRSEARQALKDFTDAYNAADRAYDPALDADRVAGALGAINQAGLKSRSITSPGGNPAHQPLELSDATFTIPKKAGWPRWFVADTDSNRDKDDGGAGDTRWVLVFVRNGPDAPWKVPYLTILPEKGVPEFKKDKDGWAEAVEPDSAALAVAPGDLSEEYAAYLSEGKPAHFADGPHTSEWRETRRTKGRLPGTATQYIDRAATDGDFAPLGLTTRDGGALVFFATRYFERQTGAKGVRPKVSDDVRALMTGEVTSTLTKEWVSSQAVLVPRADAGTPAVEVVGRLQGVTSAKGS
ncbi:hypothetical protein ACFY7Z_13260 [Streptomyces sp. NPDC012623]|uniref:hypothetical protein n=1 Tax=unclassified Streptomyces TaxID=2593676 RepID=UPI00368B0A88